MREADRSDELDDQVVIEAIRAGAKAGGYSIGARQSPIHAATMDAMRRRFSAAATVLLGEFLARQGKPPAGPSPSRDGQSRPDSQPEA